MWDTSLPSFTENAQAPVLDHAAIAAFTQWYAGHSRPFRTADRPRSRPSRRSVRGGAGLHRRRWSLTRCATTASATPNCSRAGRVSTWSCTTPPPGPRLPGLFGVVPAATGPPIAGSPRCGPRCTGPLSGNVCRRGGDKATMVVKSFIWRIQARQPVRTGASRVRVGNIIGGVAPAEPGRAHGISRAGLQPRRGERARSPR